MPVDGTRRAAALLLSLDLGSAAQLLQSAGPETVKRIAAELAYLTQSGQKAQPESIREFVQLLRKGPKRDDPVRRLLEMAVGEQGAPQLLKEAQDLIQIRDPFAPIRSAEVNHIAEAIRGESPQIVSLVLAELPAKKSIRLLPLLDDEMKTEVIRRMTSAQEISPSIRLKVATVLQARMQEMARPAGAPEPTEVDVEMKPQQRQHRKAAVVLRGLTTDVRDRLMKSLAQKDAALVEGIKKMMVLWQDLSVMNDRALQEALRVVDSRKLALALIRTEEAIVAKVRANISERAGAMLDEEISLMSSPKPEEISQSREMILDALRQINERGDLTFEES
jgi:flagellar motor switch protein FliG